MKVCHMADFQEIFYGIMKENLGSIFLIGVVRVKKVLCVMSIVVATFGLLGVFLGHNHVEARKSIVWQCRVCGDKAYCQSETTDHSAGGCGGDLFKRHVWERM